MQAMSDAYWTGCRDGRFALQRCDQCSTWQFPPSSRCSTCLSTELSWQEPSGRGRLWSWIRIHKPYLRSFSAPTPYLVVMVELDEGVRMISTLTDEVDVNDLEIDLPVEVVVGPSSSTLAEHVPLFRIAP